MTNDLQLLAPEMAAALRGVGVILSMVLVWRTIEAFMSHRSSATFWDVVASFVLMLTFGALVLSTLSGMVAVAGNDVLHVLLALINMVVVSAAIAGVVVLVISWAPAKNGG